MSDQWKKASSLVLDRWLGGLGAVLLAIHGLIAVSYSVNLPSWDLWEDFLPGRLERTLHVNWLFLEQNEHRLVLTRLLSWVLFRLGGLNYTTQLAVNFCLYIALCALVVSIVSSMFKARAGFLLIPLASGLLYEIHDSAIQTHFHLYLLFFLIGLCFAFRTDRWSWGTPAAAVFSVYSFSAGVFCAVALGLSSLAMGYIFPLQRRQRIVQAVGCLLAAGSFFYKYERRGFDLPFTRPTEGLFWRYLSSLIVRGLGYDAVHQPIIGFAILLGVTALVVAFWRARPSMEGRRQLVFVLACMVGLLAGAASVAAGRAAVGQWPHNIASRYLEGVMLLLPLIWMLLQPMLDGRPSLQLVTAMLLLAPFANEFSYRNEYIENRSNLLASRTCLANYYAGLNDGDCPQSYPANVALRLTYAQLIGASFVEELMPRGTIERLGQFSRAKVAGRCFVDELRVEKSGSAGINHVFVRGWAFHDQRELENVSVQLSSAAGMRYRLPARRVQRGDVNQAFSLPAERVAGFSVETASIALLPAGTYDLLVEQAGNGQAYVCESGHRITVAPSKFSPVVSGEAT